MVRLPLTLAIIQALMVEIRDEKYAIALGSISNIESIPVNEIKYVQGSGGDPSPWCCYPTDPS